MGKYVPVIGALGSLPFVCAYGKVLTFHDLSVERGTKWAQHEVIGQKPVLEWTGEELIKISLSIRFDSSLGVPPLVGLTHLKKMMENHKYKSLVIGGEYLGRFVIESISEERKFHTGVGICTLATAQINLIEYAGKRTISWSQQVSDLSKKFRGLF